MPQRYIEIKREEKITKNEIQDNKQNNQIKFPYFLDNLAKKKQLES